MAATYLGELKEQVRQKLAYLTTLVNASAKEGHTDANHDVEDLYCGLLNRAFGWNLTNMNGEQMNFAGIDLADENADTLLKNGEKGVAIQVSSTVERKKVEHTLDKFAGKDLQEQYKRLIILMIGQKRGYQGEFSTPDGLDFKKNRDIWDTSDLTEKVNAQPQERLEKINAYLEEQLPIWKRWTERKTINLPLVSAMTAEGFVGREDELEKIAAEIRNGTKPIFISGLGGMGKTELAVRFCKNYRDKGLGNAYMVSFQDSFRKTLVLNVAAGIPGLLDQKLNEQEIYEHVLHHLKQLDKTDILLIDNADGDGSAFEKLKDDAYRELNKLPLHLIITTRCSVVGAVKADALKEEYLRSLFDVYEVNIPVEKRDALIHAVNSHTMTVDLMARTMAEGFLTTEQMLHAMQTGDMDEVLDDVGTYHDPDSPQKRIDAHLLALFRVADVGEVAKKVLSCAILLPQGGMDYDTFKKALPEGYSAALNGQIKRGWLKLDHGTRLLTIHPVIKLVCRKALEEWKKICPEFLTRLHAQQEEKDFRLDIYRQLAEVYMAAVAEDIPTDRAMWHYLAAWYLWKQGQYKEALTYEQEALNRRQALLDANDLDLAHTYNDIGVLYGHQGDHKKALEYEGKALEIRKQALPETHPDLATSYDNVGGTYGELGDNKKALEYEEKALEIRKQALPENHPDLATSYDNVGGIYGALGDHKKALGYKEKALEIREKALPETHPNLATSYNNVGGTYDALGDHQKALKYFVKALEILKQALPENHPDLAHSYNNVGSTYGALGNHAKALEYKEKALEIRKQALSENHPNLAISYNNVGITYGDLRDHQKALEYKEKALEIWRQALPENHPALATSYDNVGVTYGYMGNHPKELEYHQKALEIRKKVLPENHPDMATSYNNVGSTYGDLRDHQRALENMEKALEIRKQALPENHPDIASSLYNLAVEHNNQAVRMKAGFFRKKKFQTALGYVREALQVVRSSPTGWHPWLEKMKKLEKDLKRRAK